MHEQMQPRGSTARGRRKCAVGSNGAARWLSSSDPHACNAQGPTAAIAARFKPVPTMSATVPAGYVPQLKEKQPAREPSAPSSTIAIACGLAVLCFVVPSIPQYVRARKLRWFHPENQLLINRAFASVLNYLS